jgi:hypothetical protein
MEAGIFYQARRKLNTKNLRWVAGGHGPVSAPNGASIRQRRATPWKKARPWKREEPGVRCALKGHHSCFAAEVAWRAVVPFDEVRDGVSPFQGWGWFWVGAFPGRCPGLTSLGPVGAGMPELDQTRRQCIRAKDGVVVRPILVDLLAATGASSVPLNNRFRASRAWVRRGVNPTDKEPQCRGIYEQAFPVHIATPGDVA